MRRALALAVSAAVALAYGQLHAGAADDAAVEVQDNEFAPRSITVAPGTTVTWTQTGSLPHSVTSDSSPTSGDSFDSHPACSFATGSIPGACMTTGGNFQHTFENVGSFPYYCRVHGGPGGAAMSGVVLVEVPDDPTPSPSPSPTDPPPGTGDAGGGSEQGSTEQAELKKCKKKAKKKSKKKKTKKARQKAKKRGLKKCEKRFGVAS